MNKGKVKLLTLKMRKKLTVYFLFILVALVGLSGVLIYQYVVHGEEYAANVLTQNKYSSKTIPFKRGDIYDTNGNILATSVMVYNLIIDPVIILEKEEYLQPTIEALNKCFDLSKEELKETITNNKDSRYIVKLKKLTYEQTEEFIKLQNDKTNNPYIRGVWFEKEYKRMYPYSTLASALIGFTESGNVGRWGIEEYYNDYLNGIDGREYGYVDEGNNTKPVVKDKIDGDCVVSTIDLTLQTICEKYVQQWVTDYNPQNVAVILADPNTGEILAMANNKNIFDLNNPRDISRYYTEEQINAMSDEEYINTLSSVWRNFCISDTYETGSTFKPFTVAAALEEGKISQDQTFLCDGSEVIGPHIIHCHKRGGHGMVTAEQSIMFSCNDALMQIAAAEGKEIFCSYQSLFGFGMKTGVDLPGEASAEGLLYTVDAMSEAALATNSFGQNFNVTTMQMIAGFSSLINGGNYYQPHIVKQVLNSEGGVVKNMDNLLIKQTITKSNSDFIRKALMDTVISGTGKTAAVEGYLVGGKTGTAQHLDKTDDNYLLSFLGYAPYDNPQVVCYAIVDSPDVEGALKGSSSFACKLFSAVMTEALPYMNIFPTEGVSEPQVNQQPAAEETTKPEEETTAPVFVPSDDENFGEGNIIDNVDESSPQ